MVKKTPSRDEASLAVQSAKNACFDFFAELVGDSAKPVVDSTTSKRTGGSPSQKRGESKAVETSPKSNAEKQRDRRQKKAGDGLIRVEAYVSRELGELLGSRAEFFVVTKSEMIAKALAKFLTEK